MDAWLNTLEAATDVLMFSDMGHGMPKDGSWFSKSAKEIEQLEHNNLFTRRTTAGKATLIATSVACVAAGYQLFFGGEHQQTVAARRDAQRSESAILAGRS